MTTSEKQKTEKFYNKSDGRQRQSSPPPFPPPPVNCLTCCAATPPLYSFNSARLRAYAVYSYRLTQFAVLEEKKPRLSAAALHPSPPLFPPSLSLGLPLLLHTCGRILALLKRPLAGCGLRQPHAFSHAGSTLHADLCANLVREIAASQAGDRGGGVEWCRNRCTMPHATSCNSTLNSVA